MTYIDYNRSGVGLVEIVSKPEIRSAEEAVEYVNNLREILLFLGVSDVKMNEGSLRCDINISLRPYGNPTFGSKVEIKNLNSLNNIKKAVEFEIRRQSQALLNGETIGQETRRFDENTQETVLMRVKSDGIDYKYFREPNLVPIRLTPSWIEGIIKSSPELAATKRQRYVEQYKMKLEDVNYILASLELTNFFEATVALGCDPIKVLNYLTADIKALLNKENLAIDKTQLQPQDICDIINLLEQGVISSKHVKTLLPIVFASDKTVLQVVEENNLKLISDVKVIEDLLIPIVKQNQTLIVENYENRPERVEKTLMGQLMKETGGNVNPDVALTIINKMIKNTLK
nr:Asp-tRNA(Asn)/Glu-tRNA(Gln) amidotransferase subunit GatB [Spiroplasma clarkii]